MVAGVGDASVGEEGAGVDVNVGGGEGGVHGCEVVVAGFFIDAGLYPLVFFLHAGTFGVVFEGFFEVGLAGGVLAQTVGSATGIVVGFPVGGSTSAGGEGVGFGGVVAT